MDLRLVSTVEIKDSIRFAVASASWKHRARRRTPVTQLCRPPNRATVATAPATNTAGSTLLCRGFFIVTSSELPTAQHDVMPPAALNNSWKALLR